MKSCINVSDVDIELTSDLHQDGIFTPVSIKHTDIGICNKNTHMITNSDHQKYKTYEPETKQVHDIDNLYRDMKQLNFNEIIDIELDKNKLIYDDIYRIANYNHLTSMTMTDPIVSNQTKVARFNQIIKNFIAIKELRPGYKLYCNAVPEMKDCYMLTIDNTYIQSLSRWYYAQSRDLILMAIAQDVGYINDNFVHLTDDAKYKLCTIISQSIGGLENIRQTYSVDQKFKDNITMHLDTLLGYANKTEELGRPRSQRTN